MMQVSKCGGQVGQKVNPLISCTKCTNKVRDCAAGDVGFEYASQPVRKRSASRNGFDSVVRDVPLPVVTIATITERRRKKALS